jgi:hypothetical protein
MVKCQFKTFWIAKGQILAEVTCPWIKPRTETTLRKILCDFVIIWNGEAEGAIEKIYFSPNLQQERYDYSYENDIFEEFIIQENDNV